MRKKFFSFIYSLNKDKFNYLTALTIRILVIIIAIELLLITASYVHIQEPKLALSELVKIIISGLIIVGLIYTILTFEATQVKNLTDLRQQRATTTYNAISQWHTSPLIDYSKVIFEHEKGGILLLINEDPNKFEIEFAKPEKFEYRKALIGTLNYFESICSATSQNLMDEGYLKNFFENIFFLHYDDYISFIRNRRIIRKRDDIWYEFTTLVEKWETLKL